MSAFTVYGDQGTIQHFDDKEAAINWARRIRKLKAFEVIRNADEMQVYTEFPEAKFV